MLPALVAASQPSGALQNSLRTLTTVREAHSLSAAEAKRGYPIHLHAVVTYYDMYNDGIHASLFVHDATGGIFVLLPAGWTWPTQPPRAGTVVDVLGISAPGDYAALVDESRIRVIGQSHTPVETSPVSLTHLFTGKEDAQWVRIEGVVHSIFQSSRNVTLNIAMADGTISAMTVKEPGADYSGLIDATVCIQGSAGTLFNEDRQMIGVHLLFPGLDAVTLVEPSPRDVFELPILPINSLSRFARTSTLPHRVHVRGRVTLQWPGNSVCIQDDKQGICAQSTQATPLEIGELADVAGFTASGGYKPALIDAVFRPLGKKESIVGVPITAEQALQGKHDAELVQIDGQLIGRDLATKDTTLLLSSGQFIFPVVLQAGSTGSNISGIRDGSTLRVTGICSVSLDVQGMSSGAGPAQTRSFHLLLRSPQDVIVLETPSWWTAGRALLAFGLAAAITAAVLGWVIVLRKRVEKQTKMIRESEKRFRHLAQHDSLTGLPTRMLLHDRLRIALGRAKRYQTGLALLMLDLDNFKKVNDSFGHDGGDQALCIMADRITATIRNTDTVARLGGDEFVVLLNDLTESGQAEMIAAKIVAALSIPVQIGRHEMPVSVSVGVCAISDGATDADVLLKSVDTAMYQAKAHGRNCFRVFTVEMESATLNRRQLQVGLGHALELQEFELHYQPLVSCKTGELTGFEALLRWRSKELGLVMPSDFIPMAEESGLIVPIGEWVMREAFRQIGLLEQQLNRSFLLAVNLSPRQLLQKELPQVIESTLTEAGRPPHRLKLEITESILMSDSLYTRDALIRIRDLGVQLAIDDFGIGFSSLSYISRFPVDWIKIDRSLICNCTTERSNLAVVRAIIAMAHSLNIRVVAEGVETAEQLSLMKEEGCDIIQGYYLSRPVPYIDLFALADSFEQIQQSSLPG
jgi:diguanylate cyclase (GGDEF)-like protein